MSEDSILDKIRERVTSFDVENVGSEIKKALESNVSVSSIIAALAEGAQEVGKKYEGGEYYLSELVMTAETLKEGMKALESRSGEGGRGLGVMVVGTVEGDLHDIGKNIFAMLAKGAGFKVIDLGIDVPENRFVEEAKKSQADIIGVSSLLTTTMANVPKVIKAVEEAGIRDRVKIILGGAPITDTFVKKVGADSGVNDAIQGVEVCRGWIQGS